MIINILSLIGSEINVDDAKKITKELILMWGEYNKKDNKYSKKDKVIFKKIIDSLSKLITDISSRKYNDYKSLEKTIYSLYELIQYANNNKSKLSTSKMIQKASLFNDKNKKYFEDNNYKTGNTILDKVIYDISKKTNIGPIIPFILYVLSEIYNKTIGENIGMSQINIENLISMYNTVSTMDKDNVGNAYNKVKNNIQNIIGAENIEKLISIAPKNIKDTISYISNTISSVIGTNKKLTIKEQVDSIKSTISETKVIIKKYKDKTKKDNDLTPSQKLVNKNIKESEILFTEINKKIKRIKKTKEYKTNSGKHLNKHEKQLGIYYYQLKALESIMIETHNSIVKNNDNYKKEMKEIGNNYTTKKQKIDDKYYFILSGFRKKRAKKSIEKEMKKITKNIKIKYNKEANKINKKSLQEIKTSIRNIKKQNIFNIDKINTLSSKTKHDSIPFAIAVINPPITSSSLPHSGNKQRKKENYFKRT